MKNFIMFKAFNKLAATAPLLKDEEAKTINSRVFYYMKLTRKTLLSLKLNYHDKDQEKAAK